MLRQVRLKVSHHLRICYHFSAASNRDELARVTTQDTAILNLCMSATLQPCKVAKWQACFSLHFSFAFPAATTSSRIDSHSARRIIEKRAHAAGVEGFISGHSLRVGSAVSLAQAGATVVDMQVAGRWKSSQMPAHYAKAELAERGAIARFKDGKR